MQPHARAGQYVNFLGLDERTPDATAATRAAYAPGALERLTALKDRFDPDNVLRLNHNIPPTSIA